MTDDRYPSTLWTLRGPSRRLRKLYRALADVDARIEAVRQSNPCPDHAPTARHMIRHALTALHDERDVILRRIMLVQHE